MTSIYTPLGLNKQGTGDNQNAWGDILNGEVIDLVDEAIRGIASFSLSGTTTLLASSGVSNQSRCAILNVTGGTGGQIGIPSVSKLYLVRNAASGEVTVTTGGPTAAVIPPATILPVVCDGASVWTLRISDLPLKDYIDAAVLAATGSLPATTGNEGKALVVSGGVWIPKQLTPADVSGLAGLALCFAASI